VAEAAKTVRGIKWAHVDSLDMQLEGAKVALSGDDKNLF
jgi:flavin-binding protein dodecin